MSKYEPHIFYTFIEKKQNLHLIYVYFQKPKRNKTSRPRNLSICQLISV
jgi:hypothetical protein